MKECKSIFLRLWSQKNEKHYIIDHRNQKYNNKEMTSKQAQKQTKKTLEKYSLVWKMGV